MPRVTQAMLERAVGGQAALIQLTDKRHTGAVDVTLVTDVLADAEAEINEMISPVVDLMDPVLATAPGIIRRQTSVAVYLVWTRGTGAQAVPAPVVSEYERVQSWGDRVAQRKRGLGLPVRPTASQQVTQVVKADTEAYYSQSSPRQRFNGWS